MPKFILLSLIGLAAAIAPAAQPAEKPRYDQVVVTGSEFHRSEWGGPSEAVVRLKNLSDREIKDVVLVYAAVAPSGTVLDTLRGTIYRVVAARSENVFSMKILVPPQTNSVRFQVESYK